MDYRIIKIDYVKPVEIMIRFPFSVLSQYRRLSDLDETWDNHIMPVIDQVWSEHQVYDKESRLEFTARTDRFDEGICYSVKLVVPPPLFDFDWIVNALKANHYEKGLCIEYKTDAGVYEVVYPDGYR